MSDTPPAADNSVDIGAPVQRSEEILTAEALDFVADLHRQFHARRAELLRRRKARREEIARTGRLDFLPETAEIRAGDWTVAPAPADLQDRRVEITGPTEPKMAINALNSGAKVWLADLEDANTPHWRNVVGGQVVLHDAVRRHARATTRPTARSTGCATDGELAVIVPRPRGWHLDERHLLVDGAARGRRAGRLRPVLLPQRARSCSRRGSGPYFYLPKMESHLEARLWDDVFAHAEAALGIPARHDPRHGADRDHPGGVRDGRDPLRAARPRRPA